MNKPLYYTPVVTALDDNGNIDRESNVRIWDNLIDNEINGIVVMGSTGEFYALTNTQKKELIDLAATSIKGRAKLFIGTGNMRKEDTIELSNYAFSKNVDGVMIIGPYYFGLTDESIELYYNEVAREVNGDIFLYNFPDRTSYDLKPSITLKLIEKNKNIKGYKDTVSNFNHTKDLIVAIRDSGYDDFIIMSGNDTFFMHTILLGGNGAIGATSNVYPELCGAWIESLETNDMEKAFRIQQTIERIKFGVDAFYIPVLKKAMILRGIDMKDNCTFPIVTCNDKQTDKLKDFINEFNDSIESAIK